MLICRGGDFFSWPGGGGGDEMRGDGGGEKWRILNKNVGGGGGEKKICIPTLTLYMQASGNVFHKGGG